MSSVSTTIYCKGLFVGVLAVMRRTFNSSYILCISNIAPISETGLNCRNLNYPD